MTMAALPTDDQQGNYSGINQTDPSVNDEAGAVFWSAEALSKIAPVLLVMIATIIGNIVLIVLIVIKKSRRRKRVNVFIVNLGIADLTVAFITMTTELLTAVFKQWVLGAFLCKCLLYLQVVTLASTTFLLTGMSIDRYQVIVRPLQSLTDRPKIKSKVVTAWIMAFVFAVPQIFIFVLVDVHDEGKDAHVLVCKSSGYSHEWQRKFYFTFLTFYILLLPAGIMLYCYTAIAKAIWNRGEQSERSAISPYSGSSSSPRMSIRRSAISSARRRVVFMTLSVIIAYLVCLTPYFIICLIRIYSQYSVKLKNELAVSQVIFMLHSALNPILYGLFTFRKSHLQAICSLLISEPRYKQQIKNDKQLVVKRPSSSRFSIRKALMCFKRSNSGETSVIIANHVAKEETSIQLKNREKSKYMSSSLRGHSGKPHTHTYSQTGNWSHCNSSSQASTSSDDCPVCVHSTMAADNTTAVSDV